MVFKISSFRVRLRGGFETALHENPAYFAIWCQNDTTNGISMHQARSVPN